MPELPEVETTVRGIEPYLKHQEISHIIVRNPRLRWLVSPEISKIHNIKVKNIYRRAKYIIIELEDEHLNAQTQSGSTGFIVIHLGMSGKLAITDKDYPIAKHDHVDIVIGDKAIRYNDPRRFGCVLYFNQLKDASILAKLGVEPLTESFNPEYFYEQCKKRTSPIKTVLMNNQIVVGVGNIYANEALFAQKIHPSTPANQLSKEQVSALTNEIKVVLERSIKQGGTTLKDFLQPDGKAGYFAQVLQVYGRLGEKCNNCGNLIEAVVIGQRNSFFCPICQPLICQPLKTNNRKAKTK